METKDCGSSGPSLLIIWQKKNGRLLSELVVHCKCLMKSKSWDQLRPIGADSVGQDRDHIWPIRFPQLLGVGLFKPPKIRPNLTPGRDDRCDSEAVSVALHSAALSAAMKDAYLRTDKGAAPRDHSQRSTQNAGHHDRKRM